jgi:glycosyltransferase involved in cell wall biosynthesis
MQKISLLIPIYNGSEFLKNCLDSLSFQDPKDIEILFLDDNSTDNTIELINQFISKNNFHTKVLISRKNRGFYRSLKILLRLSTGSYYHVIGHDDFFSPNYFNHIMHSFGMQNGSDIIFCKTISYDLLAKSDAFQFRLNHQAISGFFFLRNFFKLHLGNVYVGALKKSSFGIEVYFKLEKLGHIKFRQLTHDGFLSDHRILLYFFSRKRNGTIYIENDAIFYKGFKPINKNLNQHDGRNLNPIDYNLAYLTGVMSALTFDITAISIWMHCYFNLIKSCLNSCLRSPRLSIFLKSAYSLAVGLYYFIPGKR